jgi:hypothetical protein
MENLEKFTETLRNDFQEESGDPAINSQGEFDFDYVATIEKRLFESLKNNQDLLNTILNHNIKKGLISF